MLSLGIISVCENPLVPETITEGYAFVSFQNLQSTNGATQSMYQNRSTPQPTQGQETETALNLSIQVNKDSPTLTPETPLKSPKFTPYSPRSSMRSPKADLPEKFSHLQASPLLKQRANSGISENAVSSIQNASQTSVQLVDVPMQSVAMVNNVVNQNNTLSNVVAQPLQQQEALNLQATPCNSNVQIMHMPQNNLSSQNPLPQQPLNNSTTLTPQLTLMPAPSPANELVQNRPLSVGSNDMPSTPSPAPVNLPYPLSSVNQDPNQQVTNIQEQFVGVGTSVQGGRSHTPSSVQVVNAQTPVMNLSTSTLNPQVNPTISYTPQPQRNIGVTIQHVSQPNVTGLENPKQVVAGVTIQPAQQPVTGVPATSGLQVPISATSINQNPGGVPQQYTLSQVVYQNTAPVLLNTSGTSMSQTVQEMRSGTTQISSPSPVPDHGNAAQNQNTNNNSCHVDSQNTILTQSDLTTSSDEVAIASTVSSDRSSNSFAIDVVKQEMGQTGKFVGMQEFIASLENSTGKSHQVIKIVPVKDAKK